MEKTIEPRYTSIVKKLIAYVLLFALSVGIFAYPAQAAVLPVGLSVRMTRQTVSASTNFDVRFQMENGITSVGDTIVLTFDTGFSLASVTFSDIDLVHGASYGTNETLAASAAEGVWGVAISGQSITFTPPTDVGASEIVDNEPVAIRIGTNASGGSNQITNPSVVGRYEVTIGGGFDGFGTSIVTIVGSSAGGFTVGFTVPAVAGTGGGGTSAVGGAPAAGAPPSSSTSEPAAGPETEPAPSSTDTVETAPPPTTQGESGTSIGTPPATSVGDAGAGTSPVVGGGSTVGGGSSGGGTSVTAGPSSVNRDTPAGGGGGAPPQTSMGGATSTVPTSTMPLIPTAPSPEVTLPETPTSAPPNEPLEPILRTAATQDVRLFWEVQGIRASADNGGRIRVYPGEQLAIRAEGVEDMLSGWVEFEGSRYVLAPTAKGYETTIEVESRAGLQQGTLVIRDKSNKDNRYALTVEAVSPILVVEKEDGGQAAAVDAEIVLSVRSGARWVIMDTKNIAALGVYRRYVSAGTYRMEARKKGWRTIRQEVVLTSAGALTGELVLDKALISPLAAIKKDAPLAENVTRVAEATVEVVGQMVERARTPGVQAAAEVVAPAAVAATVGATAAAASTFNVLAYLRFLLTQPALLVRRRRREKWGLVYNAVTKQPLDLAIIRLVDASTGAVKQTRITDAQGRFAFLASTGTYRFQVVKPGFSFPSSLLAKATMDIDLVDLYHGELVQVDGSATLTPNIPVDPVEKMETPASVLKRRRWRKIQQGLSVGSLGVAGIAFILQPTFGMGLFGLAQIGVFFLFRRLAVPPKPKNWGIVYDGRTRKPLARAVVRVFDRKYNKLLETQVTDREGKYAFFAGKNIYYVTADLPGYERYVSTEIDLRKEAMGVIREPLALIPKPSQ